MEFDPLWMQEVTRKSRNFFDGPLSTNAKLNLYLFLGKLSIDTECSGLGARKYKNNCAQALTKIFTQNSSLNQRAHLQSNSIENPDGLFHRPLRLLIPFLEYAV
jgi:hypothetical protein